jgi:hypothetical protein
MNSKLKEVKITYGPHDYNLKCRGCISRGLMMEANTPKTNLVAVYHPDGKGGWLPPVFYCIFHYEDPFDQMKKETYQSYFPGENNKFVDYYNEKKVQ